MSFRHEALLWLLLLVPLASAAMVLGFRRRQHTDRVFAGGWLLDNLVRGRMPRLRVARGVLLVLTLAAYQPATAGLARKFPTQDAEPSGTAEVLEKLRGRRLMSIEAVDKVSVNDVGPRDGLQNQPKILSPAERVQLVGALLAAGMDHVEVGAFVSPKVVPAMAGTDEVLAGLPNANKKDSQGICFIGK